MVGVHSWQFILFCTYLLIISICQEHVQLFGNKNLILEKLDHAHLRSKFCFIKSDTVNALFLSSREQSQWLYMAKFKKMASPLGLFFCTGTENLEEKSTVLKKNPNLYRKMSIYRHFLAEWNFENWLHSIRGNHWSLRD